MLRRYNLAAHLALAGFLLQAAIPIGYMPGSIGDGQLVELCPDGLSGEWMAAILGDGHEHHDNEDATFAQCDLGGGVGATNIHSGDAHVENSIAAPGILPCSDLLPVSANPGIGYRPRSPPLSRLI